VKCPVLPLFTLSVPVVFDVVGALLVTPSGGAFAVYAIWR
jgi:hypothetical protein